MATVNLDMNNKPLTQLYDTILVLDFGEKFCKATVLNLMYCRKPIFPPGLLSKVHRERDMKVDRTHS